MGRTSVPGGEPLSKSSRDGSDFGLPPMDRARSVQNTQRACELLGHRERVDEWQGRRRAPRPIGSPRTKPSARTRPCIDQGSGGTRESRTSVIFAIISSLVADLVR